MQAIRIGAYSKFIALSLEHGEGEVESYKMKLKSVEIITTAKIEQTDDYMPPYWWSSHWNCCVFFRSSCKIDNQQRNSSCFAVRVYGLTRGTLLAQIICIWLDMGQRPNSSHKCVCVWKRLWDFWKWKNIISNEWTIFSANIPFHDNNG